MRARNSITMSFLRVLAFMVNALAVSAKPYGYVSNMMQNTVSVVNRANNTISASIPLSGAGLSGMAITPNGSYLYVAEQSKNSVAVISTASNRSEERRVGKKVKSP